MIGGAGEANWDSSSVKVSTKPRYGGGAPFPSKGEAPTIQVGESRAVLRFAWTGLSPDPAPTPRRLIDEYEHKTKTTTAPPRTASPGG